MLLFLLPPQSHFLNLSAGWLFSTQHPSIIMPKGLGLGLFLLSVFHPFPLMISTIAHSFKNQLHSADSQVCYVISGLDFFTYPSPCLLNTLPLTGHTGTSTPKENYCFCPLPHLLDFQSSVNIDMIHLVPKANPIAGLTDHGSKTYPLQIYFPPPLCPALNKQPQILISATTKAYYPISLFSSEGNCRKQL